MKLIILYGPPATGKMTVGRALAERTGYKLFYNHMSIDLVLEFFKFGTDEFKRANNQIRFTLFEEMAKSDLPGLIFTYVWAVGHPGDEAFLERVEALFSLHGADVKYVELKSSLEERLKRNKHPERLEYKPTKRDIEASQKNLLYFEENYKMYTGDNEYPEKGILKINNNSLRPDEVADRIIEHYALL